METLNNSVRQYFSKYQYTILQNQAWLKDSLKVQERPTDQSMKNSDMLSGSTLQITLKKLQLIEFWRTVKEYPQLSEKTVKVLLAFPTIYLYEAGFLSSASTKTYVNHQCKRSCKNIPVLLLNQILKICKNVNQCQSSH